ncbi:putative membrane protein [Burkholderia ambifaria AMMD]|nr:hypothetical protein [Burkholderia ambifaria]AJY21883.1 putative membrane protein [Burkholderia ambifaria AMMD]
MRRIAFAILGLVWGLLVAAACLYVFSHIPWPDALQSRSTGCSDMEHCAPHAVYIATLLITTLWPSVVFATLNAFAYKRWSPRRWSIKFAAATLFVMLIYLLLHVAPYLWLVDRWLVR